MTERGACGDGVSAMLCLWRGRMPAEMQVLTRMFWQSSLALYMHRLPWVPAHWDADTPLAPAFPQLRGAGRSVVYGWSELCSRTAQLLDAAWLGSGDRRVTSLKVNADAVQVNMELQPLLSRVWIHRAQAELT